MKLHKGKRLALLLGWAALVGVCAAPVVASADNTLSQHFGYQYRDFQFWNEFSNGNSNDNWNNNSNSDSNGDSNNNCNTNPPSNPPWVHNQDPPHDVPEPGTLGLALGGFAGFLVMARRRRRRSR